MAAITVNAGTPLRCLVETVDLAGRLAHRVQLTTDGYKRRRTITQPRVVQEMSFGFWTSLLNGRYETLFHGVCAQVFPGIPKSQRTRGNVSHRFESIRALRNRIFHFRRIWNRPNLQADYDQILEAISWVNPDARRLLLPEGSENKFAAVLALGP